MDVEGYDNNMLHCKCDGNCDGQDVSDVIIVCNSTGPIPWFTGESIFMYGDKTVNNKNAR